MNRVTIITPCRNEINFIESFLDNISKQDLYNIDLELIVADGLSDDGTVELLRGKIYKKFKLIVIDNPERTTPCALNYCIRASSNDIIIRMDVHTEYSLDYISQCITVLNGTGADNVGGAWHAKGRGYLQTSIALAFQSPFSSGGAGSHSLRYEGEVDSVYLGCWKKSTLERIGFFDEELVRNQDDELNLRIKRLGGKIWQSPLIKSWYYPRASLSALFKQYMQYGYWKVRVIQKHKLPASFRHIVPGLFVSCLIIFGGLAFISSFALIIFFSLAIVYILGSALATLFTCKLPSNWRFIPIMPCVFAAYHFGYGYGFIRGAVDFLLLRKITNSEFTKLTRG